MIVCSTELVPNLQQFQDSFNPAPRTSHIAPVTFLFPPQSQASDLSATLNSTLSSVDRRATLSVPQVPVPMAASPKGLEQPYTMRPRINHTLAHTLALHYNKYCFQEGVFDEVHAPDTVVSTTKGEGRTDVDVNVDVHVDVDVGVDVDSDVDVGVDVDFEFDVDLV